ncbi:MAG: HAD-IIIA family hydrolase [Candidatus Omnitrophica bacterium]|nr:HAD-IIIA family hydrolase [Candidatus Omnitrophota bacterium]
MKKFVFLDRDGVINKNPIYLDYVKKPKEFMFLPGSLKAIKLLYDAGFTVAVISNQGGIGKGLFTRADLKAIDKKMIQGIKKAGAELYCICYCIHHPDHGCACRKPKIGLIKRAVKGARADKKNSYFIGDTERDTVVGKRFGIKAIAVLSGYNNRRDINTKWKVKPHYIAKDLYRAVRDIVLKGRR